MCGWVCTLPFDGLVLHLWCTPSSPPDPLLLLPGNTGSHGSSVTDGFILLVFLLLLSHHIHHWTVHIHDNVQNKHLCRRQNINTKRNINVNKHLWINKFQINYVCRQNKLNWNKPCLGHALNFFFCFCFPPSLTFYAVIQ